MYTFLQIPESDQIGFDPNEFCISLPWTFNVTSATILLMLLLQADLALEQLDHRTTADKKYYECLPFSFLNDGVSIYRTNSTRWFRNF